MKIAPSRYCMLAAVLLVADGAWAESQATRYYEDAVALLDAGDHRAALLKLRQSIKKDPNSLPASTVS